VVAAVPRPRIVWQPIPFGSSRRAETTAYVQRHYDHHWGSGSWRLIDPRVIVGHYTASTTFASAYNTFAADTADSELHELPGTCAHFLIDTDGRIYQLVKLDTVCRHTVGLNWTAIGIEHVGMSDHDILNNPGQLKASLQLTLWLMQRFHIKLADVIGHNESLSSPYHHELYPAWRCQTHGDWTRADMNVYRAKLAALARRYKAAVGPPSQSRPTSC